MNTAETPPDSPRTYAKPMRPVVLFDGGCPLCRREIRHYQRVEGADRVEWVDLSVGEDASSRFGIDHDAAMRRFHVRTAQAEWLTGAYAFAELWSHLRGYRFLAKVVRTTRSLRWLDVLYQKFADWRLDRRGCDDGRCAVASPQNRANSQ